MVIYMSRVSVFLAEGFEIVEALAVVDICRRAGIQTDMVSVTGKRQVTSSHRIAVTTDCLLEELPADKVDMIVLPGGMPGTLNLEACEPLMKIVDDFYAQNKFIGAICAAPSILGHKGYLKGRNACSFPEFESHLEGATVSRNPVEVSGKVITSRGMGCAVDFGLSIVEQLEGKEAAEAVAQKIIYQQ